jgi:hypothetical protein
MKRLVISVAVSFALLVAIVAIVNSVSSKPANAYRANECTRYCHDHGCPHYEKKIAAAKEGSLSLKFYALYNWNIRALRQNPFGLSYQEMNIELYVIFFPTLWIILSYFAFRKGKPRLMSINRNVRL